MLAFKIDHLAFSVIPICTIILSHKIYATEPKIMLTEQLIDLFYKAEDYFFKSIAVEHFDFDGQATMAITGVKSENLNLLSVRKQCPDFNNIFEKSAHAFAANSVPWVVAIPQHILDESVLNHLKDRGFECTDTGVAMFLKLEENFPIQSINQTAEIRYTNDNLNDWMLPLVEAFESTFELASHYKETHQMALSKQCVFHHFTLYDGGKPISSLTLSLHEKIARIDDVGTLPSHQKRGYATQLLQYAIKEAHRLGAEYCFLEASESGVSVYEKIGFKPLFINKVYSSVKKNFHDA